MSGVQALSALKHRPTAVIISDQLRERIIDGAFKPGEQINEAQVAGQLQVSRGPVREALNRLVQEGLLLGRPNRGVFVQEFSLRDIAEIYEAREVLECAAVERIVARGADYCIEVAKRLDRIAESMENLVQTEEWGALGRVDLDFHVSLLENAGNSRLLRAYQTLATETLISLRHYETVYSHPERVRSGHQLIADLLRQGKMEDLHRTLHDHLSVEGFELHTHDVNEKLRHGREEIVAVASDSE